MKKSLWISLMSFAFWMLAGAAVVQAHSVLIDSTPGNAQAVPAAEVLELTYNEPVRMLRLALVDEANNEVDFGFAPNASAQPTLSYALPTLAPGDYAVNYTLIGTDGHTVSGSYTFTVDPTLSEATEAESHDDHHHHHH
jgi:methionine-rich copper-binding protein CopC